MAEGNPNSSERQGDLGRLADEVAGAVMSGRAVDVAELAVRYQCDPDEVRHCLAAFQAMGDALGEDLPVETAAPGPPSLPPDYELLAELGRGGMGIVYKVRQKSLDRTVALKILRPGELLFGDAIRRFQNEARSLARLRHRHIVSVHEVGESGGFVYFTMDFIEGDSLGELIAKGEITPSRAVKLLRQVASAVAYAHAQGLIHRDLKPANILVDREGDAYVVDFGLARELIVKADLTASGHLLGTPAYMSPEQARGEKARVGEATDVYALGAILYECLTGKPPFEHPSIGELIHAVIHEEPRAPRKVNPKVPRDLEVITQKAMAKEPERRYATARAFLEDLEQFEEGRSIRARAPSMAYRTSRLARKYVYTLTVVGVAMILLALALAIFIVPRMGMTPETMVVAANDLHEAGQHEGAVVLLERTIAKHPPAAIADAALQGLNRCRLEIVRALVGQERWTEAAALTRRLLPDPIRPERIRTLFGPPLQEKGPVVADSRAADAFELLVQMALCEARAGGSDRARKLLEAAFQLFSPEEQRPGMSSGSSSPRACGILDDLAAALESPDDPRHEVAGMVLGTVDLNSALTWLRARGGKALQLLLSSLGHRIPQIQDEGVIRHAMARLANATHESIPEEELANAASRPGLSDYGRAILAGWLAVASDLPFPPERLSLGNFPPPDGTTTDALLTQWGEARSLIRVERHRRKVQQAGAQLGGPKPENEWLSRWLLHSTGYQPRSPGDWKEWWSKHEREDPRIWLTTALNSEMQGVEALSPMPDHSDLPLLLRRFLHTRVGRWRAWLHYLLCLAAPETMRIPAWGGSHEPAGLATAWYRALTPTSSNPPYVLRAACLSLLDDRPEPEIAWQVTRPIQIGETFLLKAEVPSDRLLEDWTSAALTAPGFPAQARAVLEAQGNRKWTIGGEFDWTSDGHLHCNADNISALSGVRPYSVRSSSFHHSPGVVALAFTMTGRGRRHMEVLLCLLLVDLPGTGSRAWTASDWKSRIGENLGSFSDQLDADRRNKAAKLRRPDLEASTGPAFHIQDAAGLAEAAAILQVPEAVSRLARLDELLKAAGGRDRPSLACFRLLAGDAAMGTVADSEGGFPNPPGETMWARALITSRDPKLRDLYASYVDGNAMAAPYSPLPLLIERAIRERRFDPSGGWSEKVNGTEKRLFWSSTGEVRAVLYVAAAALLLAPVFTALALWPRRALRRRLLPAWGMILVGFVFLSVRAEVIGTDLLPDLAGYALAAAGSAILGRAAVGPARFLTPAAFGLAFLIEGVGRLGPVGPLLIHGATASTLVALAGLPLLIWSLERSCASTSRRWANPAVAVLLLMLYLPSGIQSHASIARGGRPSQTGHFEVVGLNHDPLPAFWLFIPLLLVLLRWAVRRCAEPSTGLLGALTLRIKEESELMSPGPSGEVAGRVWAWPVAVTAGCVLAMAATMVQDLMPQWAYPRGPGIGILPVSAGILALTFLAARRRSRSRLAFLLTLGSVLHVGAFCLLENQSPSPEAGAALIGLYGALAAQRLVYFASSGARSSLDRGFHGLTWAALIWIPLSPAFVWVSRDILASTQYRLIHPVPQLVAALSALVLGFIVSSRGGSPHPHGSPLTVGSGQGRQPLVSGSRPG